MYISVVDCMFESETLYILYGDMLNYVNDMNEACAVSEGTFSLKRYDSRRAPNDPFDL